MKIPFHSSLFLVGPRQTGKSALLKSALKNKSHFEVNLLKNEVYKRYKQSPGLFREDLIYQFEMNQIKVFFIDEIQKIPELLDEVHFLLEEHQFVFFLSGSSPRKLKRGQANLLGGRIPIRYLCPLTYNELGEKFNLDQALIYGTLAGIYFKPQELQRDLLITYVDTYLKEEILAEGLIRNLDPFSRFLDITAIYTTEILNYSNISRESSVALKTVQNYFEILEDTLIAYKLPAWDRSVKKQLSLSPKFYYFDNAISNMLTNQLDLNISKQAKGKLFEQFVLNQVRTIKLYKNSLIKMHFWRTQSGNEVDLLITDNNKIKMAIEIKYKTLLSSEDFSGLKSFAEDHPTVSRYIVYLGPSVTKQSEVNIIFYKEFFNLMEKVLV